MRDRKRIDFVGLQTNLDRDSISDGTLSEVVNFRPIGDTQSPRWEVVDPGGTPSFDIHDGVNDIRIISMYYHERKYKGRGANANTDLNRWLIWYEDVNTNTRYLKSTKLNSGTWEFDDTLMSISSSDWNHGTGTSQIDIVQWERINDQDVCFILGEDEDAEMYFIYDDDVFPAVIYPQIPLVEETLSTTEKTFSQFENQYYGGSYPGILTQNEAKFVGIIYAWRLPNGKYVKHSQPRILRIAPCSAPSTSNRVTTISFDTLTSTYDDDVDEFETYITPSAPNKYGLPSSTFNSLEYGYPHIFMTIPYKTADQAADASSYYRIGQISRTTETFEWDENEETIPTGEILNIDPFSHHRIGGNVIGKFRNNLCLGQIITDFALPGLEWIPYSSTLSNQSGGIGRYDLSNLPDGNYEIVEDCIIKVTIEAKEGTFNRYNTICLVKNTSPSPDEVLVPDMISYPDTRATGIALYVKTGAGDYELVGSFNLQKHPGLNMAYNYEYGRSVYALGTNSTISAPSFSDNDTNLLEPYKARIADLDEYYLPLERTYEFNSDVLGFADNTQEVGDGQFGEFPIYFLCKSAIYGGRAGEGSFISRIETVDNDNGIVSKNAWEAFRNSLWFASENGLFVLSGNSIQDLDYPIENLTFGDSGQIYIKEFLDSSLNPNTVKIESSSSNEEIILSSHESGAATEGILVYNLRYNQWYIINTGQQTTSIVKKIGSAVYLMDTIGAYNQAGSPSFLENFIIEYREGEAIDTSGDDKDFFTPSFITNPISLGTLNSYKRLFTCVLDCHLYAKDPFYVKLQGKRSTHDNWIDLYTYTAPATETEIRNLYLRNNQGGMMFFRIEVGGLLSLKRGSWIKGITMDYEVRTRNLKA